MIASIAHQATVADMQPLIGILNFDRAGGSRVIAKHLVSTLSRLGRNIRVMNWGHGLPLDPAVYKCDGVIAFAYDRDEAGAYLTKLKVPVINTAYPVPGILRVATDDAASGILGAEEFLGRGFRYLAYFGAKGLDFSDRKQVGFEQRIRAEGLVPESFTELWRLRLTMQQEVYDQRICEWLKWLNKPCGILTSLDDGAVYLSQLCQRIGLRIPEDVALLGGSCDDDVCLSAQPQISTIIHPWTRIAETAVHMIEQLMAGGTLPAETILLPPSGITRRRSTELHLVDDPMVSAALAIIAQRTADGLQVEDLIAGQPIGRRELERRFRRTLGRSPFNEIMRARVELAKRLLADRDRTLDDIAHRSGFGGARRLSEAFRSFVGTDPISWRKEQVS